MKKNIHLWVLVFFATAMVSSCSYFPSDVEEQLVSISNYDTNIDFRQYHNFSIADSIGYVQLDNKGNVIVKNTKNNATNSIVTSVTNNLVNYCHYTQVNPGGSTPADLTVRLFYMEVQNVTVAYSNWWYYMDYWWGYYPYYPYYPSYYYPTIVSDYTVKTLFINIQDVKNLTTNDPSEVVWLGAVRALDITTHSSAEINSAISDCFTQTQAFQNLQ